jgi:two-component system, NarL family, sensor kinase
MKKEIYFFLFCLIGFAENAIAQRPTLQKNQQDIIKAITSYNNDSNQCKALVEYAEWWQTRNADSSLYYLEIAEKKATDIKYNKGQASALAHKASVLQSSGMFKEMLETSEKLLKFSKATKNNWFEIAALLGIGTAHMSMGHFQEYLDYHLLAEKKAKEYSLLLSFPQIPYNIGSALLQMGETEKSYPYYLKSIELCKESHNDTYLAVSYYNFALALHEGKKYDTAIYYQQLGLEVAKKIHYDQFIAMSLADLGENYCALKQYSKGLSLAEEAIKVATNSNYIIGELSGYASLYKNYLGLKDYKKALQFGEKSMKIIQEQELSADYRGEYSSMAELYAAVGNHKKAYEFQLMYEKLNDSISNDNVKIKIHQIETQYQNEKKETTIKLQETTIKQKNTLNILFGSTAAAIFGISLFGFKNYKQKQNLQQQKISELETQQQLTATEAVLKGEEQERTRLAKDLHDGLGGMLSGIKYSFNTMKGNMVMTPDNAQAFERSMDMLDSSIKEMRRVAHNMMPEALVKFGLDTALKDFCNEIHQSGALQISYQSIGLENLAIDQTVSITIYRIVQELINNTMKHAVAKNAIVQVTKSDGQLSVTVEDDGKGFDTAIITNPTGMGWCNITNRVEFLKGKLDVNSQSGKGTSVLIEINI